MRLSGCEIYFCDQQQVTQVSVSLCSVGSEAYRIWQDSQAGRVLAVFRRSFYVQCDEGVICVGLASLAKGPLHILLASDRDSLFSDVMTGQSVSLDQTPWLQYDNSIADTGQPSAAMSSMFYTGMIAVKDTFRFSEQHVEILNECAAMSTAEHGFSWLLKEHAWRTEQGLSELPIEGLDATDWGLRQYVASALQSLSIWLIESAGTPASHFSNESNDETRITGVADYSINNAPLPEIQTLLGAGPGLTPAGDDLLAGVLLALHCIGRADLAHSIWTVLEPQLERRTNAISGAHLRMAARGQCSECMLLMLEQFTDAGTKDSSDDAVRVAHKVQALANKMGASSGWDTLAGMSLVMRAMSDSLGSTR